MLRVKSTKNTRVCTFEGEIMPRFYIKTGENTQDGNGFFHIYYRRTHCIMTNLLTISQDINERVSVIKGLLSLSVEDFYTMLLENDILINNKVSHMPNSPSFVQKEEWYEGAWSHQTDIFMKKHSLKMVKEGMPVEFIDDFINERARKRRYDEKILEMSARLTGKSYTKPQKLVAKSKIQRRMLVRDYTSPLDLY